MGRKRLLKQRELKRERKKNVETERIEERERGGIETDR